MKKILFLTMLYLLTAQFSSAQKKTIIDVKLQNFKDSVISLELILVDGMFGINSTQNFILKANDGTFHFDFTIKKSSKAFIYMNNRTDLIVPGSFGFIINPGDSLTLKLQDDKVGLVNMEIGGRGSDKLLMVQQTVQKTFSSRLFNKTYREKTMEEKYLEMDHSLSIIDSIFDRHPKNNTRDFRLAKAQLVDQTMEGLLQYCVWNFNDTVKTLFNKYVREKNRIKPLLDSTTLEYFGGFGILPPYIYLCNREQLGDRYSSFQTYYPLEYASLVQKEFGTIPFVKDYLLSDVAINIFRHNWYGQVSKDMYKYYLKNVDKENPYFNDVVNEFQQLKDVLKAGKPFYNFNLVDTSGVYHSLQQMKGKVVILDFWFTGCGACKQLASKLSEIEGPFKNDKIQFVSINVDKTKPIWKSGIGIFSVEDALQLSTEGRRTDHPVLKFGNVNAYPTLIVLDKEGKIVGIPPNPMRDPDGFQKYIMKCL